MASFWLLVTTLCKFVLATDFIPGKRLPEMNDKTCKADEQLFATGSGSMMQCLLECGKFSGGERCRSAFYRESDGRCQGCSKLYTVPTELPDSNGTVYFGKGVGWDEPSDSDAECVFEAMQEKNGVCRCRPGWPYDFQTKRCVLHCDNLGTTYEEWPTTMSISPIYKTYEFTNASACIELCNSMSDCLNIDFHREDVCYVNNKSVALEQSRYVTNRFYTHLTRNCM